MSYISTPQSSNVIGYRYDPDTRDLTVDFTSGHSGTYRGVSQQVVDHLSEAPSVGRYLDQQIKPYYPYSRG